MGLYDNEMNQKGLKFDFPPDAPCGSGEAQNVGAENGTPHFYTPLS